MSSAHPEDPDLSFLQSIGILLEQPSLSIGIFCADKLREVTESLKG